MSDRVLKEAFDKLKAIEESNDPFCIGEAAEKIACLKCDGVSTAAAWEKNGGTCPKCNNSTQGVAESINESDSSNPIHDRAIDYLDDLLNALSEEDQYGPRGDMLRYAIKRLQEVGLGRD